MKLSVYVYRDYKKFLRGVIKELGRGSQTQLATAIRCTRSYLSQVLGGDLNLTSTQAYEAAQFTGLDSAATKYFLLLVDFERAGNHKLKRFIEVEIETLQKKKVATIPFDKDRETRLSEAHRREFYGAWRYRAVFTALKIPRLATAEVLASYLGIPRRETARILERLEVMGLVTKKKSGYVVSQVKNIVLDEDPLLIENVHRAGLSYMGDARARGQLAGNGYSAFFCLNPEDVKKIAAIFNQATKQIHEIALNSRNPDHLFFIGMGIARGSVED